ncbi:MAG: hypothetical protein DMF64_00335 [Acidobacteria bacterium]|nr:MAG: hypothetical protein DMF64_00335 [Acidobacteriota bacterium]
MNKEHRLLEDLTCGLLADLQSFQPNNTDFWRFQTHPAARLKHRLKEQVLQLASRAGFVRRYYYVNEARARLQAVLRRLDGLEEFYELLQDEHSRLLLVELLRFRILGSRYVRLPRNEQGYWDTRMQLDHNFLVQPRTATMGSHSLHHYRLDDAHGRIELHSTQLGLLCTFLLEQYAYRKTPVPVQAEEGETVIDAGGCYGDTALYFAHRVGARGKVYCFEFVPSNLDLLRANLTLNPDLAGRIKLVEQPVWAASGESLRFHFDGPSTRLATEGDAQAVEFATRSIDDLVAREQIERVGFIKMDIEGAELPALQGAEQTIRAHRPKLAISVYHKDDDFVRIPAYLHRLGVGYEFFLDHFTIFGEETILFARPV